MSERLEKSYLNSDSKLNTEQRKYLVYPNSHLVPCEIVQEKDMYKLYFDMSGLNHFAMAKDLPVAERYRILVNVARLQELRNEYAFSLDPDNLALDVNLNAKVIERDVRESQITFCEQYKALIGSVLLPAYHYSDFLQGGKGLFNKNELLKEMNSLQTTEEIEMLLSERAVEMKSNRAKNYTEILKKKLTIYRIFLPLLSVITLVFLLLVVYFGLKVIPFNNAIIDANRYFILQDYIQVQKTMEKISINSIPYETKLILARSYVATEGLSVEQRSNIQAGISVKTDERYLDFWIELGRLNFDSADDYAERIGDKELKLYSLAKHLEWARIDTTMSGAAKTELINRLTSEIDRIQKELEESRKDSQNNIDSATDNDSSLTDAN